jgi:SAM-dependent methyltransferase
VPWQDHAKHPNSVPALTYRHAQLSSAASTFSGDRIRVVRRRARDKKVLDLGCVSHHYNFGRRKWLHSHVVEVAAECVGADYDEAGIKELKEAGYDVVHADVTGDISELVARGPFDVVIAGEIIEHLPFPQALLTTARDVLRPGGELVITTPNPYAPHRQRMAANGRTWENVDHVFYCFPSGMAEMADRCGLVLTKFGTVGWPVPKQLRLNARNSFTQLARALYARARGKRSPLSDERLALPLPIFWLSPLDVLLVVARRRRRMLGETAIYVLTKPESAPGA